LVRVHPSDFGQQASAGGKVANFPVSSKLHLAIAVGLPFALAALGAWINFVPWDARNFF
jgi:hypothetical protein